MTTQSSFFADLGGGGTIGGTCADPTYGDGGNGTPAGPDPTPGTSPLTFLNILGALTCALAPVNGGAPSPSPTGVEPTEPGPNVGVGVTEPEAGGGGTAGVVGGYGEYAYGLAGPNPPDAGVVAYGLPAPSTTHPLPCLITRPAFAFGRARNCPPPHLRLTLVDSAVTSPGVESAPETASMVRTVTRKKYDAQVNTPPITPTHLMRRSNVCHGKRVAYTYLMNN